MPPEPVTGVEVSAVLAHMYACVFYYYFVYAQFGISLKEFI